MKRIRFKFIYVSIFLICNVLPLLLSAQSDSSKKNSHSAIRKNSFYMDFGLRQAYASINYDRIIPLRKNYVSIRVGALSLVEFAILGEVNLLLGEKKHFFETGIGVYYDSTFSFGLR